MSDQLTLGVLTPLVDGGYFGRLISTIREAAERHGARTLVVKTLDDHTHYGHIRFNEQIAWAQVHGWIALTKAVTDRYLRLLTQRAPVILVSDPRRSTGCPVVLPDNSGGTAEAVHHLLEHGHRRIAFVGCIEDFDIRERLQGYRSALEQAGISFDQGLLVAAEDNMRHGGYKAVQQLREAGLDYTAIVTGTDLNAIGVIEALEARGVRIPEQVAVIGFDDQPLAASMSPSLASVAQPFEQISEVAVDALLTQLRGQPLPAQVFSVPTRLQPRRSCGCDPTPGSAARNAAQSYAEVTFSSALIEENYRISMALGHADSALARSLAWLQGTNIAYGCLAFWTTPEHDELQVEGLYHGDGEPLLSLGSRYTTQCFPPEELLRSSSASKQHTLLIFPLTTTHRDFGLLLLICPLETELLSDYGPATQWAAMLSAALQRRQLV